jgi:hypothetical protein
MKSRSGFVQNVKVFQYLLDNSQQAIRCAYRKRGALLTKVMYPKLHLEWFYFAVYLRNHFKKNFINSHIQYIRNGFSFKRISSVSLLNRFPDRFRILRKRRKEVHFWYTPEP